MGDAFVAEAINNSVKIFVSEIQNNDGSKVYTTLEDWNIDCWIIYIRNFGLTAKVQDKLKQLKLEDLVLNKLDVY